MNQTISDIVSDVQRALEYVARNPDNLPGPLKGLRHIAPENGAAIEVSLLKKGRRIKKTAGSHNWQPEAGQVLISYSPRKLAAETPKTEPAWSGTPISTPRFRPVAIPGDPLSRTILVERR